MNLETGEQNIPGGGLAGGVSYKNTTSVESEATRQRVQLLSRKSQSILPQISPMKRLHSLSRWLGLAALAASSLSNLMAVTLNIPSDGSDRDLVITNDTVIDLSQAVTSSWDANNSANAGKGVYDSNKWAVVFKYSSVTVASGATLTFKNHDSRAPVVWLVTGDVQIDGTVSLDGQVSQPSPNLAEPGPGGFRGGAGKSSSPSQSGSAGFGPGGGAEGWPGWDWWRGTGGSYGSAGNGSSVDSVYGNTSLIPLIGGSGGAGASPDTRGGGAGGGGAILIASGSKVVVNGSIHANGGNTYPYCCDWEGQAAGSGGGIRLVAGQISGSGTVQTIGGNNNGYRNGWGGNGRIRLERNSASPSIQISPDPSILQLQDGDSPLIWMPSDGPAVRVVSVGGNPAPADPRAAFGALNPDITLPPGGTTTVVVETTNVEDASVVTIRVSPRTSGSFTETVATNKLVVSTSPSVIRWTADVPVNGGYSALQVKVVRP